MPTATHREQQAQGRVNPYHLPFQEGPRRWQAGWCPHFHQVRPKGQADGFVDVVYEEHSSTNWLGTGPKECPPPTSVILAVTRNDWHVVVVHAPRKESQEAHLEIHIKHTYMYTIHTPETRHLSLYVGHFASKTATHVLSLYILGSWVGDHSCLTRQNTNRMVRILSYLTKKKSLPNTSYTPWSTSLRTNAPVGYESFATQGKNA